MSFGQKSTFARFMAGASVMALGMGATTAFAQDATANDEAAEEMAEDNAIVVTGIRASLRDSMNIKREAQGVVDAISAEDIGKFPDTNLAESLQRITGVSIDRDNGEGARVTVRGFGPEYNLVTLNGRQMPTSTLGDGASAPSSRSFDFGNLASEAVASVEVYKTGRATVPSGGIGSTINIRTPRPLDAPGFAGSIGVKGVYDESQNGDVDITPEVSGLVRSTFADDRIGIAVSGSYQKRKSGFNQFSSEFRDGYLGCGSDYENEWGTVCGRDTENAPGPNDVYAVPQNGSYNVTNIDRERINGQAVLQFQPSDNLTATLDYTFSQNTVEAAQSSVGIWFNHGNTSSAWGDGPVAPIQFYSENFGDAPSDLAYSGSLTANRSVNHSIGANIEWEGPAGMTWVLDAHTSSAESKPTLPYGSSVSVGTAVFGVQEQRIDYTTYLPVISYVNAPGIDSNDISQRFATGNAFRNAYFRDEIDQVQLSGNYEPAGGFMESLDFGVTYTDNRVQSAFGFIQNDTWGGIGSPETLPDDLFYEIDVTEAFRGLDGVGSANIIQSFYGFDVPAVVSILEDQFQICSNPLNGSSIAGTCLAEQTIDRRINETSLSPFVEAKFSFPVGVGDANLITGLRYEVTDIFSEGLTLIPQTTVWAAANEFYATFDPDNREFTSAKGSYDFWLPNVDFDIEPIEDVILRASYSHTITRPSYADIQGGTNFNPLFRLDGGDGASGNPNLLPFKAENFDVSAEWYYGLSSYLSVGYFRKNVENYITVGGVQRTFPGVYNPYAGPRAQEARAALGQDASADDVRQYIRDNYPESTAVTDTGQILIFGVEGDPLLEYDVSVPVNSDQTATIDGFEFAIQHAFWDTGFGVNLNYTIVNGDAKFDNTQPYRVPQFALVGLSDSANAVVYYDKGPFQARAAWNWRDDFLAGYSQNPTNPFYRDEYWQIDASASYEFDMGLTVFAEAINLTGENLKGYRRSDNNTFFAYRGAPRYAAGVRFSW